jgi:hypothetical protein
VRLRSILIVVTPLIGACRPAPAERPTELSASAPPVVSATPRDPEWKRRCAAAVQEALAAAAALEPALRGSVVETEERDAVIAYGPMGFAIHVDRRAPEEGEGAPPGIWQHHAESLNGSYHVLFLKRLGDVSAGLAFDGWPSPKVWPLVPGLQAGIDRCFGA